MSIELTQRVIAFIAKHHVMSLASCSAEGPHAANLLYAHDGLSLFWVSDPKTRHSRDTAREPRVAITIAPDTSDFVYRFEPFRVALVDNTLGFGHKELLDLREGEFKN